MSAANQLPAGRRKGQTNTRPTYAERQAARERRAELRRLDAKSFLEAAQQLAGATRGRP
jgi:hypothetical protein